MMRSAENKNPEDRDWTDYDPGRLQGWYDNTTNMYRMALQIERWYNEDHGTDYDELHYEDDALPALVHSIFYRLELLIDDDKKEIWIEFIRQFVSTYIDRPICCPDYCKWRSYIVSTVLKYKKYIEDADGLWDEISSALNKINEQINVTGTNSNTGTIKDSDSTSGTDTRTVTNSATANNTGSASASGSSNSSTDGTTGDTSTITYNSTKEDKSTNTVTGSTTQTDKGTSSSKNRQLHGDYPQSDVSASSTTDPVLTEWTYASDLNDTKSSGNTSNEAKGTSENKTIGTVTNKHTGDDKTVNSGTSSSTGTATSSSESSSTNRLESSGTASDTFETSRSASRERQSTDEASTTNSTTRQIDASSDLDANIKKLEVWQRYNLTCINKVIKEMEIYFMASFYDDENFLGTDGDTGMRGYIDFYGVWNLNKYLFN